MTNMMDVSFNFSQTELVRDPNKMWKLHSLLGLPTVPISSGQSRFSAFCPDRIFASVGTIQCPDFPKYKIKVT